MVHALRKKTFIPPYGVRITPILIPFAAADISTPTRRHSQSHSPPPSLPTPRKNSKKVYSPSHLRRRIENAGPRTVRPCRSIKFNSPHQTSQQPQQQQLPFLLRCSEPQKRCAATLRLFCDCACVCEREEEEWRP